MIMTVTDLFPVNYRCSAGKMVIEMGYVIYLMVGAIVGFSLAALLSAAKDGDEK